MTSSSDEANLSLNGEIKKFSFLKRKSKPVLTELGETKFTVQPIYPTYQFITIEIQSTLIFPVICVYSLYFHIF